DVRNGTLNLNGPVTQVSGNTLSAGTWQGLPTGVLNLGSSIIRTLGAGATLNLLGTDALMPSITTLNTNNGHLNFPLVGVFNITPFGGTFTNNGTIDLAQHQWLRIVGGFTQTATGVLSCDVQSATDFGRIIATGAASLNGTVA